MSLKARALPPLAVGPAGEATLVIQTVLGTPGGGDTQIPHWLAVRLWMQCSSAIVISTRFRGTGALAAVSQKA
jgi:hypothetical protein